MTLRVIDIETTGTDPKTDAIIEIASVDLARQKNGFSISNRQETLIAFDGEIPAASSAVHHIVADDLALAPTLISALNRFTEADAYVAHNASFERSFLDKHFDDATWVCTYKCALRAWPDAPAHSNQVLRYWLGLLNPFGIDRKTIAPHRALSDVIVTAAIFAELTKVATWPQMLEWTSEPPLISRFTFGKHRGVALVDTPLDYLDWIVRKSDLDEGVKFSAQREIERRSNAERERRRASMEAAE